MDIVKILNKIDSRIIYLLISVVVLIPLLIKIPVTIEPDDYSCIIYKNMSEILDISNPSNKSNAPQNKLDVNNSSIFFFIITPF